MIPLSDGSAFKMCQCLVNYVPRFLMIVGKFSDESYSLFLPVEVLMCGCRRCLLWIYGTFFH